jgi:hypothetical protein
MGLRFCRRIGEKLLTLPRQLVFFAMTRMLNVNAFSNKAKRDQALQNMASRGTTESTRNTQLGVVMSFVITQTVQQLPRIRTQSARFHEIPVNPCVILWIRHAIVATYPILKNDCA